MKKATKIIGAVLGVLLVAALFTGAAAAADETNLGDVHLWKLYSVPLAGTWTDENGNTAEMVLDDVTGEWYFSGNNTEPGKYTQSIGTTTFTINLVEPTATIFGLTYKDDKTPAIDELIGNVVSTDKAISLRYVDAAGLLFTNPGEELTSGNLVGAESDVENPLYLELVQKALAILAEKSAVLDDAEVNYNDSDAALDLVLGLEDEDLQTVKEFVLQILKDWGYGKTAVYTAIAALDGDANLAAIQEAAAGVADVSDPRELDAQDIIAGITAADLQPTTAKDYALSLEAVQDSTFVKQAITGLVGTPTLAQVKSTSAKVVDPTSDDCNAETKAAYKVANWTTAPGADETYIDIMLADADIQASTLVAAILNALPSHSSLSAIKSTVAAAKVDGDEILANKAVQAIAVADFKTDVAWTPMEKAKYLITKNGLADTKVWNEVTSTLTDDAALDEIQAVAAAVAIPKDPAIVGAKEIVASLTEADFSVKAQVLNLLVKADLYENSVYEVIEAIPDLESLFVIKAEAAVGYALAAADYLAAADEAMEAYNNYMATATQTYTNLNNVETGTWTVQAAFVPSTAAYDETDLDNGYTGYASLAPKVMLGNEYYFTVVKGDAATKLEKSAESIIQGGYDTVMVTAPGYEWYNVSVDKFGSIPEKQAGVDDVHTVLDGTTYAKVYVGAEGVGQFVVKSETSDDIKVTLYKADGTSIDKTLTIKVNAGEIKANATGAATYIGNEVEITGTNDLGGTLNAFIKGPNFNFANIDDALTKSPVSKEWDTKIKTEELKKVNGKKPDAGNYTVYFAKLTNAGLQKLNDEKFIIDYLDDKDYCFAYTTVVVALKQPFIQITEFPDVVVKGDKLVITGTAEGQPGNVMWYIFGTNFFDTGFASVDDNGVFEITYPVPKPDDQMQANQYFAVVQHPMYNKIFNVGPVSDGNGGYNIMKNESGRYNDMYTGTSKTIFNTNDRQSANAAQALCDALDDQNIDDMYVKKSFFVAGPSSVIGAIPEQIVKGEKLTISGVAIGHAKEAVSVDLLSTAFAAVPKETVGSASFTSATARVGDDGLWTITIDTSDLNADDYTVSVAVGQLSPATSKIKIVEGTVPQPTTQPTAQPTAQPTGQPTQTPASPGFGILAALAGLGAVAVLLLRRQ